MDCAKYGFKHMSQINIISRRRDDSNVVTNMHYGVASSWSWSKSTYNPETCTVRIRGTKHYCLLLKVKHLALAREMSPILSPTRNMVILHLRVGLSLYVILKRTLRES